MSKQIVVPNHAWAGSYHFTASDPATGHVRPPARRPRNLWRRVDPNGTDFWVAVVPAATGTNFVAPYDDASQDAWDGWAGDTIIISAGPNRATAETVAHFHEALHSPACDHLQLNMSLLLVATDRQLEIQRQSGARRDREEARL